MDSVSRTSRTSRITLPATLEPVLPDFRKVQLKERKKRWMEAKGYFKRHWVRDLPRLSPGDNEAKAQGTVASPHHNPCSYLISEPQNTLAHRASYKEQL